MNITVKQDENNPVLPEILASSIKAIADAVRQWQRAGLQQRALILLLHDVSKVGKQDIAYVLNSLAALEREFCIQRPVQPKK